jgi:hypothetical protein
VRLGSFSPIQDYSGNEEVVVKVALCECARLSADSLDFLAPLPLGADWIPIRDAGPIRSLICCT